MFLLLALYRPEAMVQPATDHFTPTWGKQKERQPQVLTLIYCRTECCFER